MQFELTKQYLAKLRKAINDTNTIFLSQEMKKLHEADIADVLDELSMDDAKYLYDFIEEGKAADVMVELEDDVREKFLAALSSKEIAD